jgi:predicted site-specific integrase-resolvase
MREVWLTLDEACQLVDRSPQTIRRWARQGLVWRRYTWNYEKEFWFPEYEDISLQRARVLVIRSKHSFPGPGRGHKKV